jgi:hypothetical protein
MKKTILILAAALAIACTSGATAAYVVHTSDIANGAVTHSKLSNNSVWHANLGGSVVQTTNVAPGAIQPQNLSFDTDTHLALWFTAYHTGAILQQSGGITQTSGYDYSLPVAGGLDNCALVASGASPEEIGVAADPTTGNQLDVTPGNTQSNFSVAVFCPGRVGGASAYGTPAGP